MKQFFKFMLASMSGCLISGIILIVIFMGIISGMASMFTTDKPVVVKDGSILRITLNNPLLDRTINDDIGFSSIAGSASGIGLDDFIGSMKRAATDPNVKGVLLDLSEYAGLGMAMSYEVRQAIETFKESGKFVVAYSDGYSQGAYYLATVADKVYINHVGMIELKGLMMNTFFLKGLLDKLDIEAQIIRHGKFKSAVEPFMLDKMSEANKEQMSLLANSMWGVMVDQISTSRGISTEELNRLATDLSGFVSKGIENTKLVDGLMYRDQMEAELKALKGNDDLNYISLESYSKAKGKFSEARAKIDSKIAIVYAVGEIGSGVGDDQRIGSTRIAKAIRDARENKKVKAIVLRVNSPGGSAVASEIIRREIMLTKGVKPIVVSMGNMAASGGYWISANADLIYADPTTLTGSIGVFGMIPNFKEMLNKKLGITFDGVKTNENADVYSVVQPLTPYQRSVIQKSTEDFYQDFIEIVAEGRKMTTAKVDSIGQGRVWSGVDALRIGLVDKLGGIEEAIVAAANMADLNAYDIVNYPKPIDVFEKLMKRINGTSDEEARLKFMLGNDYKYVKFLRDVVNSEDKIQARVPFEYEIY